MTIPSNLYHYTEINSLGLILANKTIRFSALNRVNDMSEGHAMDIGDLGMYVFVSCWTISSKESLPLWNMYTPRMRGVRIKIPFPVFDLFKYGEHEALFKEEDFITENHLILSRGKPYKKVIYTNDIKKLKPKIIREIDNNLEGLHLDSLGIYKEEIWDFEDEMRFRFLAIPKPKTTNIHDELELKDLTKIIDSRTPLGFSFFDLKISESTFEKMEITLGPKLLPGDQEIIQSLVAYYNPKAKIRLSNLNDKIR